MMVDADLGATEPGDVVFSHVSARAIEAVCLLMLDSLDLETLIADCSTRLVRRRAPSLPSRCARMNDAGLALRI
jgi:hypothetical protein